MYTLSIEKKLAVLSALVEGNSIRSINRMTNADSASSADRSAESAALRP